MSRRLKILLLVLLAAFAVTILLFYSITKTDDGGAALVYGYKIINTYPHDPNAFTQGLVFEDGFL